MRVIETSLDEDLKLFSSYLWQHRVVHRIFEERGRQVVELADPALLRESRDALDALTKIMGLGSVYPFQR